MTTETITTQTTMSPKRALALATTLHADQTDLAGDPYILHVIRVMYRTVALGGGRTEVVASIFHDAVEDTDATLDDLADAGVSEDSLAIIESVTRRDGEPYEDFIDRCHPLVKLADLLDNYDPRRLTPDSDVKQRPVRYAKAIQRLAPIVGVDLTPALAVPLRPRLEVYFNRSGMPEVPGVGDR